MRQSTIFARRTVLAGAGALAATGLLPQSARAAEFEYKMGHSSPESHPFHKRLLEVSDRIAKGSGGRMTLTIFPNSQLGGDNDLLSQCRSGAVDFVQPAGLILASILPLTAVNGMGFAFPNYAKVWEAMDGDLGSYIATQIRAKVNLVPMKRRWDLGFRQITNSVKPINGPDDVAGMKLRIPGAPALVSLFKELGAYPVSMQFGEVYTSLQTKVVDGEENPLSVIDAGKLYEVQKYCAITDHVWDGYWICANPDSWGALPDDLKKVAADAFDEVALLERADLEALDKSLKDQLQAKGLSFTAPDTTPFRERLSKAGFYAEWQKQIGNEAWDRLEHYVGKLA